MIEIYATLRLALPLLLAQLRTKGDPSLLAKIRNEFYSTEKKIKDPQELPEIKAVFEMGLLCKRGNREGFDGANTELTSMIVECIMIDSRAHIFSILCLD